MKKVVVVDYGSGNLRSVSKALEAVAGSDASVVFPLTRPLSGRLTALCCRARALWQTACIICLTRGSRTWCATRS